MTSLSLEIPSIPLASPDGLQTAVWRRLCAMGEATVVKDGAERVMLTPTMVIGFPREPGPSCEGFLALDVRIYGAKAERRATDALADRAEAALLGRSLSDRPLISLRNRGDRRSCASLSEWWAILPLVAVMPGSGDREMAR